MKFPTRTAGTVFVVVICLSGCEIAFPANGESGRDVPSGLNQNRFIIAGRVSDANGFPVSGLPVRVSSSFRPVDPDPRVDLGELEELGREETASDGTYRLVIRVLPGKNRYYINFFDPHKFDSVQYAMPDRIDITNLVSRGGTRVFNFRLSFHGGWEKVQETLKAYPRNSPKARIIRKYGIAEEIQKKKEGRITEIWWYFSYGRNFGFQGDRVVEENTFLPVIK